MGPRAEARGRRVICDVVVKKFELQWGRVPKHAEGGIGLWSGKELSLASMGPRAEARGRAALSRGAYECHVKLQWGRVPKHAEG